MVEGACPYIHNSESTSIYSTNSMSRLRARYRQCRKSVSSEPVECQGSTEWHDDYDHDSEASMDDWRTASLETVEYVQPEMGSMFVAVAPLQPTVLEHRRLSREQPGPSMDADRTRREGRQRRSLPHLSALDKSLHAQRSSEVESRCTSDEQAIEQRMKQLVAARRELDEILWRDADNDSRTACEQLELDGVTNKHWRKRYSSLPEDDDEDEEAEIAATLAFMNGDRRMSCTADFLEEIETPLDLAVMHHDLTAKRKIR